MFVCVKDTWERHVNFDIIFLGGFFSNLLFLVPKAIFFYKSHFKNPLKNPTSYEVGFLSGILKVGFVEKYGLKSK